MSYFPNDCFIEKLPPEIMYKIFDYLDLRTVKYASRTCHRWEHIIFSDSYIGRFVLDIRFHVIYLPPNDSERRSKRCGRVSSNAMKIMESAAKRSTRCYSYIKLNMFDMFLRCQDPLDLMNALFQPNKAKQLVVLKIEVAADCNLLDVISTALPQMINLRELYILSQMYSDLTHKTRLNLQNDSLKLLVLTAGLPDVILLPNLRVFDVSSHLNVDTVFGKHYAFYGETNPNRQLRQLEQLTINFPTSKYRPKVTDQLTVMHRPGYNLHFYQHLTKLQKLHFFDKVVSENLFMGICASCALLEDLFFNSLKLIDAQAIESLSKLTRLKRLGILNTVASRTVSFTLVKLPNLSSLYLGNGPIDWESLNAFSSLKSLTLPDSSLYRGIATNTGIRYMSQLEELSFCTRCRECSCSHCRVSGPIPFREV